MIGADTEVFMSYIADQTSAGNLIKVPVTDRKNYLTPAEAEALLHPIVPDTPANSETGQTNTENTSSTNGSAADAKQSQEITVDNSAAPQLLMVRTRQLQLRSRLSQPNKKPARPRCHKPAMTKNLPWPCLGRH